MKSVRSSIATSSSASSTPSEFGVAVCRRSPAVGSPSVLFTNRTKTWTPCSSRVRSTASSTSASLPARTPLVSVTGPVQFRRCPRHGPWGRGRPGAPRSPRRQQATGRHGGTRGGAGAAIVDVTGPSYRLGRAAAVELRWRAAPSAARSSRCRARRRRRARRRPASVAPRTRIRSVFVARPASVAPQLGHLADGGDVVERDARQSIALGLGGLLPRALGQPDAALDRRPRSVSTSPMTRTTTASSARTGRSPARTSRRNARYGSRWWASSSVASIARASKPRNQVRSQL